MIFCVAGVPATVPDCFLTFLKRYSCDIFTFPVFSAELVIAHRQAGVHGVYDQFRYEAEKHAALERWEALLTQIIDPPPAPANVIPLRAG